MQININADAIKAKLQQAWEEQPVLFIVAATSGLTGFAKIMNANTARKNSKTWRKEVDRRIKTEKKTRK